MARHAILIPLLLLSLLTAAAASGSKSTCKPECLRHKRWNKTTCPRKECTHIACSFHENHKWIRGHRCIPRMKTPRKPTPDPQISNPPRRPKTCKDKCLHTYKSARSSCNLSKCKIDVCHRLRNGKRTKGYRCIPKKMHPPSPKPSSKPFPPGCPRECHRSRATVTAACNPARCVVRRCRRTGSGPNANGPGFNCVRKPKPTPPPKPSPKYPPGCPRDCNRFRAPVDAACNPARCVVRRCRRSGSGPDASGPGFNCVRKPKPTPPPKPSPTYPRGCSRICRPLRAPVAAACNPTRCVVRRCRRTGSGTDGNGPGFNCVRKPKPLPSPKPSPTYPRGCSSICRPLRAPVVASCNPARCVVRRCRRTGSGTDENGPGFNCVRKPKPPASPSPSSPSRPTCPEICLENQDTVSASCDPTICIVKPCSTSATGENEKPGFFCVPKTTPTATPSPTPTTSPTFPAKCPELCLDNQDTVSASCDPNICIVKPCSTSATGENEKPGFFCVPKQPTPSSSPPPLPSESVTVSPTATVTPSASMTPAPSVELATSVSPGVTESSSPSMAMPSTSPTPTPIVLSSVSPEPSTPSKKYCPDVCMSGRYTAKKRCNKKRCKVVECGKYKYKCTRKKDPRHPPRRHPPPHHPPRKEDKHPKWKEDKYPRGKHPHWKDEGWGDDRHPRWGHGESWDHRR